MNLPPPQLITEPQELEDLAQTLADQPVIAVDTESNSLYAYQEQVCLIQFSTPEKDYLVDPLAIGDLSALEPIFASEKIEKIFHAAEYDLICLERDFCFEFANLFDTMLAARILGRNAIGLGSMLENEFGVHLNKRYQRADWGRRPLPPEMLSYARLDTHYLIPLRDRLQVELQDEKLWPLAQEDFHRLTQINGRNGNGHHNDKEPAMCWKVKGAYDLDGQQAAVLQELCRYRDHKARNLDRPLFKVINDRTLLAIAQEQPKRISELKRIPGMSKRQIERHGKALLAAVQRGLKNDPIRPPRSPRPDEDYVERVERLRRWRKGAAQKMGVNSDVVLPRDLMLSLAQDNPNQMDDLQQTLQDVPWRVRHFGTQILNVLSDD